MNRTQLSKRFRLLGLPMLIPMATFVLVAYGGPDPSPPFQTTANFVHNLPSGCKVIPPHIGAHATEQLSFKNQPPPKGKDVTVIVPPGVFDPTNFEVIPIKSGVTASRNIHSAAIPGVHDYYVIVKETGEFCEGKSHPGIVVR